MRQNLKRFIFVQAVLSVCLGVQAKVADRTAERYEGISGRNLFGLKAPPAQETAPAQAEAPTKLFLTGITTIRGEKRVLLKEQPPAGKPAKPTPDQSLILSEGQREGGIEVLQIDPKGGKVKVNNSGMVQTLTFDKDGVKTPAAPAAPAAPPPLPTTTSAPYPPPVQPGLSRHTLPSRTPRWPATGNSTAAATTATTPTATGSIFPAVPVPQGAPTPTGSASGVPEPALPGSTPAEVQNQLQPELSLEQQVMVELQQEGQQDNAGAGPAAASATPAAPQQPTSSSQPAAPGATVPGNAPANGLPNAPAVYPQ